MVAITIDGGAIIGAREEQQDARAVSECRPSGGPGAPLIVVADGMGGHSGGAIASLVAVEAFVTTAGSAAWPNHAETLRQALTAANQAIADRIAEDRRLDGMGCTLVAAVFEPNALHYVSVGDSLLLRIAGAGVERLNADHSMSPLLDASGAPADDPQRHMLRSALTGGRIALIDGGSVPLAEDSLVLVATDGLLTLDAPTLLATVEDAAGGAPAALVQRLLERVGAEQRPDQDNCTVVAARVAASPHRGGGARAALGALLLAGGIGVAALAWHGIAEQRQRAAAPPVATYVPLPQPLPSAASARVRREPYPADPPLPVSGRTSRSPAPMPSPATAHGPGKAPAPTPPRHARPTPVIDAIMSDLDTDDRVSGGAAPSPSATPGGPAAVQPR